MDGGKMKIAEVYVTSDVEAEIVFTHSFIEANPIVQKDLIQDLIVDLQTVYFEMDFDTGFEEAVENTGEINLKLHKLLYSEKSL
jgi:hypothetical protein